MPSKLKQVAALPIEDRLALHRATTAGLATANTVLHTIRDPDQPDISEVEAIRRGIDATERALRTRITEPHAVQLLGPMVADATPGYAAAMLATIMDSSEIDGLLSDDGDCVLSGEIVAYAVIRRMRMGKHPVRDEFTGACMRACGAIRKLQADLLTLNAVATDFTKPIANPRSSRADSRMS
jgi:hypothetical protein